MTIITSIEELIAILSIYKKKNLSIGLVPTMGAFHKGHLALMKQSKRENDITVVSLFVNPIQFSKNEDYSIYPQNIETDAALAEEIGVDFIFNPTADALYPKGFATFVDIENAMIHKLCGASRASHFKGVTTIVSKLFNIVAPNRAYFGQKDAQQLHVIKTMVKDLNFQVEIIACETIRESDGLAMSSRNIYLDESARQSAQKISYTLFEAKRQLLNHNFDSIQTAKNFIINYLNLDALIKIEYVEILDYNSFESVTELKGNLLIAIAVKIGPTRLIDNVTVYVQ